MYLNVKLDHYIAKFRLACVATPLFQVTL